MRWTQLSILCAPVCARCRGMVMCRESSQAVAAAAMVVVVVSPLALEGPRLVGLLWTRVRTYLWGRRVPEEEWVFRYLEAFL